MWQYNNTPDPNELYHGFKYIKREWKNGRWNYTYKDKELKLVNKIADKIGLDEKKRLQDAKANEKSSLATANNLKSKALKYDERTVSYNAQAYTDTQKRDAKIKELDTAKAKADRAEAEALDNYHKASAKQDELLKERKDLYDEIDRLWGSLADALKNLTDPNDAEAQDRYAGLYKSVTAAVQENYGKINKLSDDITNSSKELKDLEKAHEAAQEKVDAIFRERQKVLSKYNPSIESAKSEALKYAASAANAHASAISAQNAYNDSKAASDRYQSEYSKTLSGKVDNAVASGKAFLNKIFSKKK